MKFRGWRVGARYQGLCGLAKKKPLNSIDDV